MLTVKEINEVTFGQGRFSGYKPEDVDKFIDQVAASFQELIGERDTATKQAADLALLNSELAAKNADSQRKLSILAQKIETYRQEEEGIKEAIVSAQKMSKDLIKESQSKADAIVKDARAQAEATLSEANEEARRITSTAKEDAAKAAREYAQQAETKKNELEEIKRQVTAFRSSLLEMYKKHLECIDHIPVFRQKEEHTEPVHQPEPIQEPEPPAPVPVPEPEREPEPPVQAAATPERYSEARPAVQQPVIEQEYYQPSQAPVEPPAPEEQPGAHAQTLYERYPAPQPQEASPMQPPTQAPAPRARQEQPRQARTLHDRVNYVQEQLQPSQPPENYLEDNDLSSVGIDLNAHSNIPEALRREKNSNYSNLAFGDGVDVDGRKRRR